MVLALAVLGLALLDPAADPPPARAAQRLGPEDVLRVAVFGHPDLAQELTVDPDGTFDFPLIGRVQAGGLTPREVEDDIAARLARGYVREPQVRVTVVTPHSAVVTATGQLARPGAYPLADARTLLELLSRAGPLLPDAAGEILVVRAGGGEAVRVDMARLNAGVAGDNVSLRPGDTVVAAKALRIAVSGQVRKPGAYDSPPGGMTVRQAVALAGGYASRAARDGARILRPAGGKMTEILARPDDVVSPGDTVVVEKKKGLF
jgi:polysaccharide export outer membrane protein